MSEHEQETVAAETEETQVETRVISLEQRVGILEARLGIDPHAVLDAADESQARGAEAAGLSEPAAETETEGDEPAAEDQQGDV